jgi:hypothetical protein
MFVNEGEKCSIEMEVIQLFSDLTFLTHRSCYALYILVALSVIKDFDSELN